MKKELINHKLYYCCFSYEAVKSQTFPFETLVRTRTCTRTEKKKAATCCQWEMQEWSYDSCGPQRLAAGPIWQTCVSHTYRRTPANYTCCCGQMIFAGQKTSLAPESSGIFSRVLHINLVFCFYNLKYLLYSVCIHSELDNTHISERLCVNPSLFSHCDLI